MQHGTLADRVVLLDCLNRHCSVCSLLYKIMLPKVSLKRWIYLPLRDLSVPSYVSNVPFYKKRDPLTSLLVLFPVPVRPRCTSSVYCCSLDTSVCFSSAHHHQLPVVVTPWCCFPAQHRYNLICK